MKVNSPKRPASRGKEHQEKGKRRREEQKTGVSWTVKRTEGNTSNVSRFDSTAWPYQSTYSAQSVLCSK